MTKNARKSPTHQYQDILFEYAVGTLPSPLSLAVAAHLPYEPEAFQFVRKLEAVGGSLIDMEDGSVNIGECLLEQTLDMLERELEQDNQEVPTNSNDTLSLFGKGLSCFPSVLEQHITTLRKKAEWVKLSEKIEFMCLSESPEESTDIFMARLQPGASIPHHDHDFTEVTFVLEGAFSDENGNYKAGSLLVYDEENGHHPKACPEQGCLCLCVTSKPVSYEFFKDF